jgi:hypothetical protein
MGRTKQDSPQRHEPCIDISGFYKCKFIMMVSYPLKQSFSDHCE